MLVRTPPPPIILIALVYSLITSFWSFHTSRHFDRGQTVAVGIRNSVRAVVVEQVSSTASRESDGPLLVT
jgi:hypothetical protein